MSWCSRCGFYGKPLEAIPCLLAMRTFLSASRPMAKTVVSAVKPGGQALQALLVGLSYWCFALWVGGAVLYIDNGGLSLVRRHPCRAVACQPVWQSLVPDHHPGLGTPPCCGLFAKPGENSRFVALARVQRSCRGRPSGSAPGAAFVIHWIHVSIFFPQQNVRRT